MSIIYTHRTNRNNLLSHLSPDAAEQFNSVIADLLAVNSETGTPAHWSAESVPTAFLPAIDEVTTEHGFPRFNASFRPLELSPLANMAENEVLSQIANGQPTLVTTSSFNDPTKLIRRICLTFPAARIVVMVRNKTQGKDLVAALREVGIRSWYFSGEYKTQPDVLDRVRVVKQTRLSIISLELHNADIVIASDAIQFVRNDYFGHSSQLFDIGSGTHFKPDVRLVGLVPDSIPMRDRRLVYPTFGLRTYELSSNGNAFIAPWVTMARRTKDDRSDMRVGLDSRLCWQKKTMIWQNPGRNNFISKLVQKTIALAGSYPFVETRYGTDLDNAVSVVVENHIHASALREALNRKSVSCGILTFDEVRNSSNLPSILVRADAGIGLLPIGPQVNQLLVVDVKDESPKFLRQRVIQREKAYLASWHLGNRPLAAKLLSLKHLTSR